MRSLILSALAALALPLTAHAQPIAAADLDALFETEPRVEVNLRGSLLRLAAAATAESEPETAAMIEGLDGVTVRIYPAPATERALAVDRLSSIAGRFESDGWLTLVRIRALPDDVEDEGDVWVFVCDRGDVFGGLAVMLYDADEENALFVHIDGEISPDDIGALTRRFGDVDIDYNREDDDE
jgi:hypothetical protein